MSDEIHAQHQFVPKLLRRKLDAAHEGRERFIEDKRKELALLLLANRNVVIAKHPKFKVLSIEETARLPWTNWDDFRRYLNLWYDEERKPKKDAVHALMHRKLPHRLGIVEIFHDANLGSAWVKRFREVRDNLSKSATRRVYVSTDLLSIINRWASYGQE